MKIFCLIKRLFNENSKLFWLHTNDYYGKHIHSLLMQYWQWLIWKWFIHKKLQIIDKGRCAQRNIFQGKLWFLSSNCVTHDFWPQTIFCAFQSFVHHRIFLSVLCLWNWTGKHCSIRISPFSSFLLCIFSLFQGWKITMIFVMFCYVMLCYA